MTREQIIERIEEKEKALKKEKDEKKAVYLEIDILALTKELKKLNEIQKS